MTEVDEIAAALTGPVNNWLNNEQLLKFQRLVQIARWAERRQIEADRSAKDHAAALSSVAVEAMKSMERID